MKAYTDITVLLDRSGSMEKIKGAMEEALNNFVREHASVKTTKFNLIQFDGQNDQEISHLNVPINAVEGITINPRSTTPLLDAAAKAIDFMGARYASMSESDRPDQVLFVIITDGAENASRTFKRQDVFDRISKQHDNYKWQFVFLGANQDAIKEAASIGIKYDWAMEYVPTLGGTRGMSGAVASNTVSYANRSTKSIAAFDTTQRNEAMDNTTGGTKP